MAGRRSGSVMCQKAWSAVAPSMRAASYGSWGRLARPARAISMMRGVHCQMSTTRERVDRRRARVGPLERRQAGERHQVVRHAERRVVHHHEHEPDGDRRRDHGQDRQRPQEAAPPELPVEQERHRHAEHRLAGDDQPGEVERADDRLAEARVADEDLLVVGEADELRQGQARGEPVLEAHPHRVDDRVDDDRRDDEDGRGGEEPPRVAVAPAAETPRRAGARDRGGRGSRAGGGLGGAAHGGLSPRSC